MRRISLASLTLALSSLLIGVGAAPARAQSSDPFEAPQAETNKEQPAAGKQSNPQSARETARESEQVVRSLEQWRKQLTPEQFLITRMKATEAAFSGKYAAGHWKGTFLCVCCDAKLFDANTKFDSGTGWPSFDRPFGKQALETAWDYSEPEARVEVTCRRCGAHLGHVFQDGPTATGLRFCINSIALKLDSEPKKEAAAPNSRSRRTSRAQPARSSRKAPKASEAATRASEKAATDKSPKTEH